MRQSDLKVLGQRVKRLRESKGLSQVDVAVGLSMSKNYISAIERGAKRPSLGALKKLARLMGVKAADLIPF